MPLPSIPGVVRVAVQGQVSSGQQWVNVWHFRFTGGASSPGASDITALDAQLIHIYTGAALGGGESWMNECASTVKLAQMSYLPLDSTSLATVIPHVAVGAAAAASLPSEVAHVLTLRSAVRGRSHRGRVYLPARTVATVDPNGDSMATLTANFLTQCNAVKTALGGASVAPFWEFGVASYLLNTFTPLASFTMDAHPDVQRRRRM